MVLALEYRGLFVLHSEERTISTPFLPEFLTESGFGIVLEPFALSVGAFPCNGRGEFLAFNLILEKVVVVPVLRVQTRFTDPMAVRTVLI